MSSVANFSALSLAHLHFFAKHIYIIIPSLENKPLLAYESASVLEKALSLSTNWIIYHFAIIILKKPLKIFLSLYNFCFPGEKKDSTIYFVLIITIPLIVAVSTVILLVYLKR